MTACNRKLEQVFHIFISQSVFLFKIFKIFRLQLLFVLQQQHISVISNRLQNWLRDNIQLWCLYGLRPWDGSISKKSLIFYKYGMTLRICKVKIITWIIFTGPWKKNWMIIEKYFLLPRLQGPGKSWKSTLIRHHLGERYRYVTFDDPLLTDFFYTDPKGFLSQYSDHVIFDEVQKVPELFQ